MKKKLEGDLISIAHRILKLKGKEDVVALHKEAKEVFEKLSVLLFFEEQFKDSVPDYADSSFFQTLENVYNHDKVEKNAEDDTITRHFLVSEDPEQDELVEPLMETIKNMVAEMPEDEQEEDTILAEAQETEAPKRETLEDILADVLPQPTFVKSDEVATKEEKAPKETETVTKEVTARIQVEAKVTKTENKPKSLNDRLNTGISIGLNDRIAFTKHLFDGNQEDYNRVISQLNTIESETEAKDFIYDMIKPDYNNWEGKEEYETRFMEIVERKFA
ncbi:hypothetical protein C8N46_106203 [Kordia periserrulae]|uniref:Uncharacterized protein n=1 Tax=Kordia periserrulae TaxID=701523 RepID=A0A2T6BX68_9FLAO|nr:hypothetical protein [Kordia periserrulae]PTX60557.1 hypothetical protein C8N46_106203 [Kordia periserrulae]